MTTNPTPLIVSFGEMLIDFVPDVSGVSLAESGGFIKAPGGAPANVACAITKLGGKSAFIGKIVRFVHAFFTSSSSSKRKEIYDEFGHMLVDILKKNGVNSEGVCYDPHARTALAFVTLKKNGEREFMFYRNPSADMLLQESELNMGLLKQAKVFHYGSISLISEPCRSAHLTAMKAAREAGILLSYDPNVRLPLWQSSDAARDGIKSIWNEADFIKVSDDEVAFLTQGDPQKEDVVLSLWHDRLKLLSFKGRVPGFSVKVVDTTGAGDAFVGSLLLSVAKDTSIFDNEEKLREALSFANACGAICTTQKGAIPALPSGSDALALMKSKAN
ncbi:hypothetical protein POTOM_058275 [Populus tomentosa]|uniref:fructokinase n=1 Tax=Populus tomentosa TaxID=118781 RepID=A0A8X7XQN8_POPTO|nr:hypothetical protein POTOM_058275 [Populus tomentosa]